MSTLEQTLNKVIAKARKEMDEQSAIIQAEAIQLEKDITKLEDRFQAIKQQA